MTKTKPDLKVPANHHPVPGVQVPVLHPVTPVTKETAAAISNRSVIIEKVLKILSTFFMQFVLKMDDPKLIHLPYVRM